MMKALVVLASLLAVRTAAADDLARSDTPDEPTVAITLSPFHMFVPMAELTAEIRLADRLGVAAIAGAGRFRDRDTNQAVTLFEGGVSARYYALGTFRTGLQLGAEAVYVKASTEATNIDVQAAGLGLSPFAGYKWTHRSGFTLEGQLGATFMVARAKADTGEMAEESSVGPMLNLQVGYTF